MSKKRRFYQKKRFMVPFTIGLALIFLGVFGAFHSSLYQTTTNAYVDEYLIKITPKMNAKIVELNVENNSIVKKGEILAELDGEKYVQRIKDLEKEFFANREELENFDSEIEKTTQKSNQAKVEIEVAKLNLENANEDYVRYKNSFKDGVVTKKDLEKAIKNLEIAQEQYEDSKEKLQQISKSLKDFIYKKDEKNMLSQEILEDLDNARLELSNATVISPKNGKVQNLKAKVGEIANADEVLFEILPDDCYIIANFKNLPNNEVKVGQKATVKIYTAGFKRLEGVVIEMLPSKDKLISAKIKIEDCVSKYNIKSGAKAYVKVRTKLPNELSLLF